MFISMNALLIISNVKMGLLKIRWSGMVWIGLPQDRHRRRAVVSVVKSFRFP
jgi:hypothetical protein